jgi:hypothetical protein
VQGNNGSISSQSSCPITNDPREEIGVPSSNPSSFSFNDYLVASAAASTVVEQHDRYDLDGFRTFIAANFSTIPADVRPYLVIGAAAGAQHAAQIHFLAETHEAWREPGEQEIASRPRCSLSSWIIGLHRGSEFFRPVGHQTSCHTLHGTAKRAVPIEEKLMDVTDPAANIVQSSSLQTRSILEAVTFPVSQVLSDAALDVAVAAFTRQLGEQKVTRAAELFGGMIDRYVAIAEPWDTSEKP